MVPALELLPLFRVVIKPLAERVARSQILEPLINPSLLPAHPPRPQVVHKNPEPVFGLRRVIDAL